MENNYQLIIEASATQLYRQFFVDMSALSAYCLNALYHHFIGMPKMHLV